jgi:Zn-dependent protease
MMLGRLTLNPVRHIDPVGTLLLPVILVVMQAGFIFGWAKPVPVTWENLRHPKRDMIWVAVAGPAANLIMAIGWGVVLKVGVLMSGEMNAVATPLIHMAKAGIIINIILMAINLIPIPPLDGGRVLAGLLPGPWAWKLSRLEPYGMLIMVVLLVSGLLGVVLGPVVFGSKDLIYSLFSVRDTLFSAVNI